MEETTKRKLFLVSDFAVDTGFGNVAHNIANRLLPRWDIYVLAINYYGDPTPYQKEYTLFNPALYGDVYGYNRIKSLVEDIQPDAIMMINDPWICNLYVEALYNNTTSTVPPILVYMPVDSYNLRKTLIRSLNAVQSTVAYTDFARKELYKAGLMTPVEVIPHGIDTSVFYPVRMDEAREFLGLSNDLYIVNITDRNALRKRVDLGIEYFAEWAKDKPETVKLYYHGALKDSGWDIIDLAEYYGIQDRLLLTAPYITAAKGITQEHMKYVYSAANVGLSTTMGEGWGLTAHERMACGVPMILPQHSAYAEWADNAAYFVACTASFSNINQLNTVGRVPDKESTIDALEHMYISHTVRDGIAKKGYKRAIENRFSWDAITHAFEIQLQTMLQ